MVAGERNGSLVERRPASSQRLGNVSTTQEYVLVRLGTRGGREDVGRWRVQRGDGEGRWGTGGEVERGEECGGRGGEKWGKGGRSGEEESRRGERQRVRPRMRPRRTYKYIDKVSAREKTIVC